MTKRTKKALTKESFCTTDPLDSIKKTRIMPLTDDMKDNVDKTLKRVTINPLYLDEYVLKPDINSMSSEQIADFFMSFIINKEFAFAEILSCFSDRILEKLSSDSEKARDQANITSKRFEEAIMYLKEKNSAVKR